MKNKKKQQNAFRIDKKLTRKNAISNLNIVDQLHGSKLNAICLKNNNTPSKKCMQVL